MGLSRRVFLVDDNDYLQRLPIAQYERLLRGETQESLPQYAGNRIRYVLVLVELVHRRPVAIQHIEYSWLSFDSEGRLDVSDKEKEARLAMEVMPSLSGEDSLQVINARHRFAKRRYDTRYKWKPGPEIQAAIIAAIFGKNTA